MVVVAGCVFTHITIHILVRPDRNIRSGRLGHPIPEDDTEAADTASDDTEDGEIPEDWHGVKVSAELLRRQRRSHPRQPGGQNWVFAGVPVPGEEGEVQHCPPL